MRSIKGVFNKIRSKNPYWSDYICFAEVVRERNFQERLLSVTSIPPIYFSNQFSLLLPQFEQPEIIFKSL